MANLSKQQISITKFFQDMLKLDRDRLRRLPLLK